jgi:lysophospholipase L1-like esterase
MLPVILAMAILPSAARAGECSVPDEVFLFEPTLPRFVAALGGKKPVTVVAIGSASTEGLAAGEARYAWPEQLGVALRKRFPDATIDVVNLGKRRQTAAAMAAQFEKTVLPLDPKLVIWETGTVDAVRGTDLDAFRDTLESGLTDLRTVTDVVLMDTQFSRRTSAMIDFEPYERAMRLIADVNDVPLYPRHELMRDWSEHGELDLSVTGKEKRKQLAQKLYRCIGETLAAFVSRPPETPRGDR